MGDNINMTADEFFDRWTEWCSMTVTADQAALLNTVFANIMHTFEERGSPPHHRQILNGFRGALYTSPDSRKEAING